VIGSNSPWRDLGRGLLFLAPNLGGFLLFTALPVLAVLVVAFTTGSYTSRVEDGRLRIEAEFCGLDNFRALGDDLRGAEAPTRLVVAREANGWSGRLSGPTGERSFSGAAALPASDPELGFKGPTVSAVRKGKALEVTLTDPARPAAPEQVTFVRFGDAAGSELDDPLAGEWTAAGRPEGELRQALRNTAVLMLAIPAQMAMALALALLLNKKGRTRVVLRTLLFLPTVAAGIALYMVWRQLFNQEFGLLNQQLSALGVLGESRPDWLGDPDLAKPALIVMLVGIAMGGTNMVLYLAGLQDIDPSLYEAASIDGAGRWDTFRAITWPALKPTTFFIFTTNLIGGFQIFDQVFIMTRGGPEGSTSTILYHIYKNIYEYQGKLGYAAATSVLLFGLVLSATLVTWFADRGARESA
jgi:multiple sugar transport system permease protein